jgi:signal transduction histidine kinase/PAS domain-containing protein
MKLRARPRDPDRTVSADPPAAAGEHETLFGEARDGVAVLSPAWRIRYANASLLEILGLIGHPATVERLWDALPEWEGTPEGGRLREAMEERVPVSFRVGGTLGRGRVWEVSAEPLSDGDLRLRLHNATAREVIARAVLSDGGDGDGAPGDAASGLFHILDALPIGIAVADGETGRIVYVNPAAVDLCGRPRDLLAAPSAGEYVARWQLLRPIGGPMPQEEVPLARALRGETVREVESVLARPDGTERTVLSWAVPIRGPDGGVRRALLAFHDITDRLRLEQELMERTADAEHAAADAAMRADEGRALREMGRALVSSPDPEGVWRMAAESAMELLGARGGFVATPREGGAVLRIGPALGSTAPLEGTEVPFPGTAAEVAFREGSQRVSSLEGLPETSPLRDCLRMLGTHSLILVPMRAFGGDVGLLGVVDRSGGFTADDVRLLEAFADSAALAGHNARLLDEARRRAEGNRALLAAAEVLGSTLDPAEVRERVVLLAEEMLDADGAALGILAGESGDEVWVPAASGMLEGVRGLRAPLEGTLTGAALAARRPLAGSPEELEAHASVRSLERLGIRWHGVAPLLAGEEGLGAIGVVRREGRDAFSPEELRVLAMLASQAALAVRNAGLHQEVQQASRAKTDFLSAMSHELRTPLNALEGYASLLAEGIFGPLTGEQRGALDRMRTARAHLTALIDEVLDIAQLEAGTRRVALEPVLLAPLLEGVVETMRVVAERKGLRLRLEAGGPREVRTDAGMLRQVVMNLLGNALKFTAEGEIAVRSDPEEDGFSVRVRDTGSGIAPELLERIFEPFFQADPSTTRGEGGVGLGLALSREFARLLGGELTVESRPGEGSTFTLRLPGSADARARGEDPG